MGLTSVANVPEPTHIDGMPGAPKRRRRPAFLTGRTVVNVIAVALLVYLIVSPLIMLVIASFQDASGGVRIVPPITWSLINFVTVFGDVNTYEHLLATGLFAACALLFAFTIAMSMAWLIERTDLPFRNVVFVLLVAPIGIPHVISAIAWSLLLNPNNGVINLALRQIFDLDLRPGPLNVYTMLGMSFIQGMALVPLTFLLIAPTLASMSANFEAAARASGASFFQTVRRITIPLWKPALLGTLIYELTVVVEVVDVPLLIGLPGGIRVFATDIYRAIYPIAGPPDYGAAATFGLTIIVFSVIAMTMYNRIIMNAASYATVTGKSFRPSRSRLGRWKPLALLFVVGYVLVSLVLPLFILLWTSLQPYLGPISLDSLALVTTDTYRLVLLGEGDDGGPWHNMFMGNLRNTLILGFASGIATVVLALILSWIVVRSRSRFRGTIDTLSFVGHAIPSAILAIAVFLIYLLLPNPIYGTIWIVVIAVVAKYISLGTRGTTAGITQIQVSLEEAAAASGANSWQVWRKVLLPLLAPTFLTTFLLVFLAAATSLTLPLFLRSGDSGTLSTLIFYQWNVGNATMVAVLCVVVVTTTIALTIAMRYLINRMSIKVS